MQNLRFSAVFGIMMLMLQGLFAQYQGQLDFNTVDVNVEQTDGWDVVTLPDCYMETDVSKPYLPVKHLHIAIPEDKKVTGIEIINIQQQELSGNYNIMPTQPGQIPGEPEPDFVNPVTSVYNVNEIYPAEYIFSPTAGFVTGVHIAGVLYYPLTYNPITKKLYLATHIEYKLLYADENNNPVKPRRMLNSSYLKLKEGIKLSIENPNDVDTYFQLERTDDFTGTAFAPDEFPNFNGQAVEYVIITNQNLAPGFQEIADWKTQKGMPAVVRTVEWIYANYPGVDHAEKVRNFIIDAFQNWGAQYFMLGGDSEQVPIRYAWISPFIPEMASMGEFIPADMYFACLDGNWNADGDATFGEADWDRHNDGTFEYTHSSTTNLDDVDRYPDVVVSRVPVEDYTDENGEFVELARYKTKFFEYVKTSQGNENNVLLFNSMEPSYHIYQVKTSFPDYVNFTERYNTGGYNNMDVLDEFNGNGPDNISHHIICGLGHGGPTSFAAAQGSLNRIDMDGLINTDRSQILYLANHCSTMPWDKNTVTEHYINSENGGVAVIANTSFGWTSMVFSYNKPFIQKIYNFDYHIGKSFNKTKKLYNNLSYYDGSSRLIFFSLSLASDPEMPVWTDSPDSQNPLIVNVPSGVVTGQQTIQVNIDNLSAGTEGIVCLYKDGEVYARAPVTGTGNTVTVAIDCTPDTPGDILVTVTAKNYLPVETSIPVTANPGIHLYISEHTISGDENIDAGETINLGIELSNSGLTNANGVNATLSCQDNIISITTDNSAFGNIAAGSSEWSQNNFVFTVAPTLDEDKTVTFNLEIHDANGNVFNDNLLLEIKSPKLQQSNRTIKSTSNGDLIVETGETVHFDMDLFNNSHSMLQNVTAILSSQSPYVENILQSTGTYGNMASYETKTNANEYSFKVSANYPGEPEPIPFSLDATNNFGQQWHFDFDLLDKPDISDIVIDFRGKLTSITLFWTVYENVLGYNIYRSNTIDGEYEKLNNQILPIAYFEDDGLEQLTTYYYKVSAISPTGNESNLSQPKKAWTSLAYHPDWLPITVSNEEHGDFWGAPNVYDLDNDGKKEIFITSGRGDHGGNVGTLFGFREDGEELYDIDQNPTTVSGFSKIGISMTCSPAIGDIDNDGITEIVVATRMGDPDDADKHKLLVYKNEDANGDGKPDLMWEKQIAYKNFNGVVLSDLDDNGTFEIIVPNQWGNKIEILDYLGNNFPGWPKTLGENPVDKKAVSMPVAVNLDNAGNKEIVIGYEGGIYIWNSDGTDYLGQNPININIPSGGRLDCPVIAANIDNDGYYEILFMSIQNKTGYIYAIESNGDLVTGWDNDNHSIELSIQSQTWAWPPSFVCGDVDMDGNIEVVIADNTTLKVWNNVGNLILDKNIPLLQCQYLQPLIADVDGIDDECEIIIPSNNGVIYAFKLNGDPVLGWPLYLGSTSSVPLITDIDNDSKNEIIAASGSDIYVWDTKGYSYKNQWGSFRLNSYNNAVYDNICNYNNTPLVVDNNETWNSVRRINSDVIVDNATLTINSLISFVADAKIIVKPGAKLILNGATLTNACSSPWQGIQVWGDKNHSQYPDANGNYYQGYLEMNNAVIENAVCAVDLWKPGDWSSTGGIVYANGATFRNNTKSVHALYYQNFNPYYPTQQWDYSSNFKNCTFEITSDYPATETFYKHVDLSHVKGIDFYACDFSLEPDVAGVSTWNSAIAGYDAQFRVSALCNSQVTPCPEEDLEKCTFTGFYRAVSALNDGGSPVTFYVSNADFINNAYGVKTRSMNNATVLFSNFEIGQLYGCGAGINSDNVTGFAFEENNFSKYTGGPQANYFGIIINNSHSINEVYKNNFTGLSYANFADGKNWIDDDRYHGLAYYCNQNS